MIEKKTIVDQIEITRSGAIQVRFGLLIAEGDVELDCKWHRTTIGPGDSVKDQIAAVNEHLVSMGKAPVGESETVRLAEIVKVAHKKYKS